MRVFAKQPVHYVRFMGKVSSAAMLVSNAALVEPCLTFQVQRDQFFNLIIGKTLSPVELHELLIYTFSGSIL